MPIAHQQLAQLNKSIYETKDGFDQYWELDDVVIALKKIDDIDILILRGSLTAEDWIRDAEVLPEWHSKLGFCHSGFLEGMDKVYVTVKNFVGKTIYITGHSLGGARARILAGMFIADGIHIDTICVFGSPKPAFINLARIIQKSKTNHISYRNRNDVVPTLPFILPMWEHTEQWKTINCSPCDDDFSALRDHSIDCYLEGLSGL